MMPSVPERLAAMENTLERLDHTINGNGQPGMAQKVECFITEQFRQKDEQTRQRDALASHIASHAARKFDWQWAVTALIAVGSVVVAVIK